MDEQDALNVYDDPARSGEPYKEMSALQKTELLKLLYNEKPRKRRKFFRKPYSIPVDYTTREGARRDVIKDISGDGLFIETRSPLRIGEEITMEFSIPDSPGPFKCKGKVVRQESTGMAVEFKWSPGYFG